MYLNEQKTLGIINAKDFLDSRTSLVLTGGKFVGVNKKVWIDAYLKLGDDDQAISCFKELGELCIPVELDSGELPAQVKGFEHFCVPYL